MNAILEQPTGRRSPKPTLARAEYLLSAGDAPAAIACSRKILRRDPSQIGALEVLAKALWQMGAYDDLLTVLSRLLRLNPYEPGYHALRGAVCQSLGRTGEAIKAFARAGSDFELAGDTVTELREWQRELITGLLSDDPVFRAHYAQDPEDACRARGFEFVPEFKATESWLAKPQSQAALFTRPS